jgi:hypothetical protein
MGLRTRGKRTEMTRMLPLKYLSVLLIVVLLVTLWAIQWRNNKQATFLSSLIGANVSTTKKFSQSDETLLGSDGFTLSILEISERDTSFVKRNILNRGVYPLSKIINDGWVRVAWTQTPMSIADEHRFLIVFRELSLKKWHQEDDLNIYLSKILKQTGNYYAGQYLNETNSKHSSKVALYVYAPHDKRLVIIYADT